MCVLGGIVSFPVKSRGGLLREEAREVKKERRKMKAEEEIKQDANKRRE